MLPVVFCILLLFLQVYANHRSKELPEFIVPCKFDSNLSDCPRKVLEDLRPHLVKGIPAFGLPSIDPMHIPRIEIERRNSKIADYNADIRNIVWTGCKDFNILEVFIDPDALIFRLKLAFPYLQLDAEGFIDGTMLGFEMHSFGGGQIKYTKVVLDFVLNGEMYNYKGRDFIKWKAEDLGINYEDAHYANMYGFLHDPTITKLFELALYKGARLLAGSFRLMVDLSIGSFILESINRVHKIYPKDILYST